MLDILYVIAFCIYAADQIIKFIVRTHLHQGVLVPVFPPFVDLDYIQNPGGAFSIFPHHTWLFVSVAILVILAVIWVHIRYRPSRFTQVGLGCVLGGALGNMTDRIVIGRVTDYVYLQFIHFPIFNLADVSIDVGVAILIIQTFRQSKKSDDGDGDDHHD
ncbi:MAG: signal peptidase II [Alicyclobacillaceae bacterium]|uniref:signal peptidase II n=1 Tax=Alicyclobacillus sp. SP_1 TaxID=2942475 RepID=UPI002158128A|nr:signal peptidase II [Alicyclobacillus sp. SP_1]MCY0886951.1 signal peptidase II [Alicyclobacillaceae bacterium]